MVNLDQVLDDFEQAWKAGGPPDLRHVIRNLGSPHSLASDQRRFVHELVMIDFWHRWRRGANGLGFSRSVLSTRAANTPVAAGGKPWPRFPRLEGSAGVRRPV